MRHESSVTSISWIPSEAIEGMPELPFELDERGIDLQIADPGRTAIASLGASLTEGTGELVSVTQDAFRLLVEASLALILVIVLSVYMLLYGEQIGAAVRRIVPRGDGTPEDDFPTRGQRRENE